MKNLIILILCLMCLSCAGIERKIWDQMPYADNITEIEIQCLNGKERVWNVNVWVKDYTLYFSGEGPTLEEALGSVK